MQAYHNDPAVKETHLAWLRADIAADRLVAGNYGQRANGGWRGCQWGCFLRSSEPHAIVEEAIGVPRVLSKLSDGIFEALSRTDDEAGRRFAERFFAAIPVGADLSRVWPQFAVWLLDDPQDGVIQFARSERSKTAIRTVADLYRRHLEGVPPDRAEWKAAAAAYAAAAAAAAAYAYAYAYADAYADADAAYAAYAAADAYAYADARHQMHVKQADKLIALLEAAR